MNMLIIVMGVPGSGKSYFSARLAEQLSAVHLQTDRIRKDMNLKGKYSDEEKLLVYQYVCEKAEELLKKGETVIVDATFHLEILRELFFQMAAKLEIQAVSILVEADEITVKRRLENPRKHSEADYEVYQKIMRDFDPVLHPFLHITSTDTTIEAMLHKAINYLKIGNDT
ncbi:AAA family ATPase [Algoriphagus sp. Y33]|uniref:AAA family ATPase n=1 Tax=Algoriphagus sp. Y33 TaxID=2772483 RepID=UPI00177DDDDD|nr:AAA family ATPase [Algoriphagus sp. Y33]